MDLSVIIVNWNTRQLLLDCLDSVFSRIDPDFEVWLVDNGSSDGSVEAVAESHPSVRIVRNERNLGFAAANNKALREMNGRYALLLNTDTVLDGNAVGILHGFLENHPDAAMACGQLLNGDGSLQRSTAAFPSLLSLLCGEPLLEFLFPSRYPGRRRQCGHPIEVDSCIGACMMVRKAAIDSVGLLDERYFFFFEETDWALRMKRSGWRVFFVPAARIYHLQGQSVGHSIGSRIYYYKYRYAYFRKWYPVLYPLIFSVLGVRLFFNLALNAAGAVCTLGLHAKMRKKTAIYARLVAWHLRGCPCNPWA